MSQPISSPAPPTQNWSFAGRALEDAAGWVESPPRAPQALPKKKKKKGRELRSLSPDESAVTLLILLDAQTYSGPSEQLQIPWLLNLPQPKATHRLMLSTIKRRSYTISPSSLYSPFRSFITTVAMLIGYLI